MAVDIAPHRKQASSIVKSMLDPRNSVIVLCQRPCPLGTLNGSKGQRTFYSTKVGVWYV